MMRFGPGPVFGAEWVAGARRWQGYALRSWLVGVILAGLWVVWENRGWAGEATFQRQAELGRAFYGVSMMMLLGLVGLAAPAATAGAICLDKARGNLLLLFATDLSDAEIVLGKLLARLVPVLGLIACASPVMVIMTLFGGVDPTLLAGAILVCLACAVFGCTLALVLSIWGRKTHEVLLMTYAFGLLWIFAAPLWYGLTSMLPPGLRPVWLPTFEDLLPYNPIFLVMSALNSGPAVRGGLLGAQAWFCGLGLLASALLAGLAVWRMRAVVVRQAGRSEARKDRPGWWGRLRAALPSPDLDGNPVLWREWHRQRPSRWSIFVWGLFGLVSAALGTWAISEAIRRPGLSGSDTAGVISGFQVAAGLLLLSVSAATSLAEERQRGSLDVLMATPLSTRSIVLGKWLGAFRGVPILAILPAAIAAATSMRQGYWYAPILIGAVVVSYGAAITSLGLAMATWVPKMGRAIGLTVGIYLALAIGSIPMSFLIFDRGPNGLGAGMATASPFWGVGYHTATYANHTNVPGGHSAWLILWAFAYSGAAAGLLFATARTFDRCLGRASEGRRFL